MHLSLTLMMKSWWESTWWIWCIWTLVMSVCSLILFLCTWRSLAMDLLLGLHKACDWHRMVVRRIWVICGTARSRLKVCQGTKRCVLSWSCSCWCPIWPYRGWMVCGWLKIRKKENKLPMYIIYAQVIMKIGFCV